MPLPRHLRCSHKTLIYTYLKNLIQLRNHGYIILNSHILTHTNCGNFRRHLLDILVRSSPKLLYLKKMKLEPLALELVPLPPKL